MYIMSWRMLSLLVPARQKLRKEKRQILNCDDIVYIVKIQPLDIDWNLTTIGKCQCFCGKLIAQFENDSKTQCLVFELNGPRRPTVVIPKGWIEWMAPNATNWRKDDDKQL